MGLFAKLFGKESSSLEEMDKMPPIYGGDATSVHTAATINCASMGMANHLIDRFISEQHGQKDTDWSLKLEYFIEKENIPEFTRAFVVTTKSEEKNIYYFNVARPMNGTMQMTKNIKQLSDELNS